MASPVFARRPFYPIRVGQFPIDYRKHPGKVQQASAKSRAPGKLLNDPSQLASFVVFSGPCQPVRARRNRYSVHASPVDKLISSSPSSVRPNRNTSSGLASSYGRPPSQSRRSVM